MRSAGDLPTSGPVVVDAAAVASLLDITPRAGRRLLHTLAELGLAWQMPPTRTTGPGRPRQSYRLMLEKLG
jgi:predicted ArsR family transcriptional regulator